MNARDRKIARRAHDEMDRWMRRPSFLRRSVDSERAAIALRGLLYEASCSSSRVTIAQIAETLDRLTRERVTIKSEDKK